jgi:hypothetical protein
MTKIAETVKTKNAETLRNLELAAIPRQTIKPDLNRKPSPTDLLPAPELRDVAAELLAALEYMNNFYLSNSHKRSCQADPDPQRCPHCKAEAAMKKARGQQ